MCKSANRHWEGFTMHRIKWLVSWNCGKVLLSQWHRARGVAIDSVITRIRSGWFGFNVDLMSFWGLPLGAKDGLSSACVCSIMLYWSGTWLDRRWSKYNDDENAIKY